MQICILCKFRAPNLPHIWSGCKREKVSFFLPVWGILAFRIQEENSLSRECHYPQGDIIRQWKRLRNLKLVRIVFNLFYAATGRLLQCFGFRGQVLSWLKTLWLVQEWIRFDQRFVRFRMSTFQDFCRFYFEFFISSMNCIFFSQKFMFISTWFT